MSFAAPWLLLALAGLPVLWWLLRLTPPLPRTHSFPPIALLRRLRPAEETPAQTPPWLLALRLAIAALVIIGLAGPRLGPSGLLAANRPVLLVVDDGWSAAADWPARLRAADAVLDQAARRHLPVALLTLARDARGAAPTPSAFLPAATQRARLAALRPLPWPIDGAAAAASLRTWAARDGSTLPAGQTGDTTSPHTGPAHDGTTSRAGPARDTGGREAGAPEAGAHEAGAHDAGAHDAGPPQPQLVLVGGGVAQPGMAALWRELARFGPADWIARRPPDAILLRPILRQPDRLVVRAERVAGAAPRRIAVVARDEAGGLARVELAFPAGATSASAPLVLPAALRNRLRRLVVSGPASAAGTLLLDQRDQRHAVGLLAGSAAAPETPLLGALFYLRAALAPIADLPAGDLAQLIGDHVAMIVLADGAVADPAARDALAAWVAQGGVLVRFAGPALAALAGSGAPDPLLPVRLLPGARQLGGAMSWTHPETLAPFPPGSPFAGLPIPPDITVRRQVLAAPGPDLATTSWATLTDGTPLISGARHGEGWVVLVHVTANADWSSLPLSPLFPRLLRRLLDLANGGVAPAGNTPLAARSVLDGVGRLLPPGPAVLPISPAALETIPAGPRAPPGLYGPAGGVRARNLGAILPPLAAAPPLPGARLVGLDAIPPEHALGPWLLAAAAALFAADLLAALALRGLLRAPLLGLAVLLAVPPPAHATAPRPVTIAQGATQPAATTPAEPLPDQTRPTAAPDSATPDSVSPDSATPEPTMPDSATPNSTAPNSAAPNATARNSAINPEAAALTTSLAWLRTGDAAADAVSAAGLAALSRFVTRHTAASLGPPAGVVAGVDDLSLYPLLYWGIGAAAPPPDGRAIAALDDFMSHGGILVIDTSRHPDLLAGLARGLVVPPLVPLTPTHVLAHSFYLLHRFPGIIANPAIWVAGKAGRDTDGVSPIIIGDAGWAAAWVHATRPAAIMADPDSERQGVLALRFGVNLVMYALTGTYKGDQVHVPTILRRLGTER